MSRDFADAAREKLQLNSDWKWVRVYQCTKVGKRQLSYESTGFSKVHLRHAATGAEVSVIVADAEWQGEARVAP